MHIKVVEGEYAGETGVVVAVVEPEDPNTPPSALNDTTSVIVLTDLSAREITCRLADIQESSAVSQGLNSLMGYELYDLVAVEQNVAGVVVHVGRTELRILDNHAALRTIKPEQLRGKLNRKSMTAVALDSQTNTISPGIMVTILDGPHKKTDSTVKHIFKHFLFLHANSRIENAGMIVVRARTVKVTGQLTGQADLKGLALGGAQGGGGAGGKGGKGGKGSGTMDELVGMTCRIKRGKHKGMIGMCVDSTETHLKIEVRPN